MVILNWERYMSAMGNPADDFSNRADLWEIIDTEADFDAAYRAVMLLRPGS
jgi:hypothetical protein